MLALLSLLEYQKIPFDLRKRMERSEHRFFVFTRASVCGGWDLSLSPQRACVRQLPRCLTISCNTSIALYSTLHSGFGVRTETDVHVDRRPVSQRRQHAHVPFVTRALKEKLHLFSVSKTTQHLRYFPLTTHECHSSLCNM